MESRDAGKYAILGGGAGTGPGRPLPRRRHAPLRAEEAIASKLTFNVNREGKSDGCDAPQLGARRRRPVRARTCC